MSDHQFQNVNLRYERNRGRDSWIVAYTPLKGLHKRHRFFNEKDAVAEAKRIEKLFERGYRRLAAMDLGELLALTVLCDELPSGIGAARVVTDWLKLHHRDWKEESSVLPVTVEAVGEAYIQRAKDARLSLRQIRSVRNHVNDSIEAFGDRDFSRISTDDWVRYLRTKGNTGRTRNNHLGTLRAMARWARDIKTWLPEGRLNLERIEKFPQDAPDHQLYTPEEFTRILIFASTGIIPYLVVGQFTGMRSAELERVYWRDWHEAADNKFVLERSVTKTDRRRRVDVPDNLTLWLQTFRGDSDQEILPWSRPHRETVKAAQAAGVEWRANALRSGYASYHYELFDNAPLTSKNCGHSIAELETTYKAIAGVTKKAAKEMFSITPQSVLQYAETNNLPQPEWAAKVLQPVSMEAA